MSTPERKCEYMIRNDTCLRIVIQGNYHDCMPNSVLSSFMKDFEWSAGSVVTMHHHYQLTDRARNQKCLETAQMELEMHEWVTRACLIDRHRTLHLVYCRWADAHIVWKWPGPVPVQPLTLEGPKDNTHYAWPDLDLSPAARDRADAKLEAAAFLEMGDFCGDCNLGMCQTQTYGFHSLPTNAEELAAFFAEFADNPPDPDTEQKLSKYFS